jgi:hypothetical protein
MQIHEIRGIHPDKKKVNTAGLTNLLMTFIIQIYNYSQI